jgi:hypothetical protein
MRGSTKHANFLALINPATLSPSDHPLHTITRLA